MEGIRERLDGLIIELLQDWVNKPDSHYCKDGKDLVLGCMHCQNKIADEIYR